MTEEAVASGHYFLSYSRTDERFALRLAQDLRTAGVAMWIDQLDIRPSEHWDRAIERAVRECRGLVVILSPRSVASDNVADEISFAIDGGKSVLPVMIEKCALPLRITRMHVIDATREYEKALQQCLGELTHPSRQSSPAVSAASTPSRSLDQSGVSAAKQQLAPILGPIANILVDKEAARASSIHDLYAVLAQHIDNESDRKRFISNARLPTVSGSTAPPPASRPAVATSITADELAAIASALTLYVGPIAPLVAKRESRTCASATELGERLATLIPTDKDRSAFLQRVRARV